MRILFSSPDASGMFDGKMSDGVNAVCRVAETTIISITALASIKLTGWIAVVTIGVLTLISILKDM